MKHLLAAHHRAMAATYKSHADNLDDAHEHKSFFGKLASHHHDLAEALGAVSRGGVGSELHTGDLDGPGKARRASDIVPDHVKLIGGNIPDHVRLVPRAGAEGLTEAQLDPELESLFEV